VSIDIHVDEKRSPTEEHHEVQKGKGRYSKLSLQTRCALTTRKATDRAFDAIEEYKHVIVVE